MPTPGAPANSLPGTHCPLASVFLGPPELTQYATGEKPDRKPFNKPVLNERSGFNQVGTTALKA
jgi:hypothetical protein